MTLRHALLGLLDEEPASGYDLMKEFDSSLVNVWPATQSQVYSELNKMADAGFVAVAAEGMRRRKEYAITDAGRAELRRWLTGLPPLKPHRSDLLLRVFFLDLLPADDAAAIFRTHRDAALIQRDRLRGIVVRIETSADADAAHPLSVNGRIALEFGLRKAQMDIDWAEWALTELERADPAHRHVRAPAGRPELGRGE